MLERADGPAPKRCRVSSWSTGAPTVLEMALVLGIFVYYRQFNWRHGLVLLATLGYLFSLYDARQIGVTPSGAR
ncbi:MAG: hypothetical protein U1E25_12625 [Methylocystis sp.]